MRNLLCYFLWVSTQVARALGEYRTQRPIRTCGICPLVVKADNVRGLMASNAAASRGFTKRVDETFDVKSMANAPVAPSCNLQPVEDIVRNTLQNKIARD